jgi:hypothetical protein
MYNNLINRFDSLKEEFSKKSLSNNCLDLDKKILELDEINNQSTSMLQKLNPNFHQ